MAGDFCATAAMVMGQVSSNGVALLSETDLGRLPLNRNCRMR